MMDKEIKIVILAGFFAILAVIIAFLLPILFPPSPHLEITEFSMSECPNIKSNYTYTCLGFQIKNTGDEIAIINGVLIKVLNYSIIDDSSKTSSYPRISEKDLPDDMYFVRLTTDLDPDLMNEVGLYYGVDMYYPLPPQTSKQFDILLDSDKTATYDIISSVNYDQFKEIKYKPRIKLILENVNTSLSEAYPTTIEKVVKGNK